MTQELLDRLGVGIGDIPVVICNNVQVLRKPSAKEVAECLGFNRNIDESQVRDLVVVGAGPAGLAAAVYAASEGLNVVVVEKAAPGGQAASSSKIENYLGFPTGLSGGELAAGAIAQAEKFGAQIMVARTVERLKCTDRPYRVTLDDGQISPLVRLSSPPERNITGLLSQPWMHLLGKESTTTPLSWRPSFATASGWL